MIIRRGTDVRRAELSTHSVLNMSSTTVSVRIDPVIKKRLEKLAKSTGRSRSFLAAEAINEYLDLNEWQVAGIQKAMFSLDRGPRQSVTLLRFEPISRKTTRPPREGSCFTSYTMSNNYFPTIRRWGAPVAPLARAN